MSRGWYNRPVVASVIEDSVALHPKNEKKKKRKAGHLYPSSADIQYVYSYSFTLLYWQNGLC
jgi:hypothetical protein